MSDKSKTDDDDKGKSAADGRFLPGNKFWHARTTHGRAKIFETPEILLAACFEYLDWVDDNPLHENKIFSTGLTANVPMMRAMTLQSLVLFLGIGHKTWTDYRERDEFKEACERIEAIIREQKFAGAAAGLLNPVIISRDLGLQDTSKIDHTSSDGTMVPVLVYSLPDNGRDPNLIDKPDEEESE